MSRGERRCIGTRETWFGRSTEIIHEGRSKELCSETYESPVAGTPPLAQCGCEQFLVETVSNVAHH